MYYYSKDPESMQPKAIHVRIRSPARSLELQIRRIFTVILR